MASTVIAVIVNNKLLEVVHDYETNTTTVLTGSVEYEYLDEDLRWAGNKAQS